MTMTYIHRTQRPFLLVVFVALLSFALPALAGEVESRASTQELLQGETLQLLLRYRGDNPERPDLAPLGEDFDVLDVGATQRSSVINGVRDQSFDWTLTLAPRRTGALRVPAIRVGDAVSTPFDIKVLDATTSGGSTKMKAPVVFEVEVDNPQPYVQGKVQLTARLFLDESIQGGALTEPDLEGALMEQSGEDKKTSVLRDGKRYTQIERQYALFPQASGPVHIPPLTFEGTQVRQSRTSQGRSLSNSPFGSDPFSDDIFRDFFGSRGSSGSAFGPSLLDGFFDRGQVIRVRSNAIDLDVQPKPSAASSTWWLPAKHVELVEEWEPDPPVFRVGEQVTRHIAIQAVGLSGDQMPELELPAVEGLKQYPEPSSNDTVVVGNQTVAVKARSFTLLPTQPGELVLPAVEVEWWDVQADETRIARLPERVIQVQAADGTGTAEALGSLSSGSQAPFDDSSGPAPQDQESPAATEGSAKLWLGLGLFVAALALLSFAVLGIRRRRSDGARRVDQGLKGEGSSARKPVPLHRAEHELELACRAGDTSAATAALLSVGQAFWPEHHPLNAVEVGKRLGHAELRAALEELGRARFGAQASSWDGSELYGLYKQAMKSARQGRKHQNGHAGPIPALYPTPAN